MKQRGRVSHYFAGANTPQGFHSHYDQIAPGDASRVIILKGGPGVGKSTFLKRIAADLLERGHDVEYFHCSADPDSLDAVYVPAASAAVMDGTAPHVVDPKFPGAMDEIINLGEYWDEAALRAPEVRREIVRLTREYKFRFQRAYDARRAALAYLEEWGAYFRHALDQGRVYDASEEAIALAAPGKGPGRGGVRRLFASAITYDGARDWLESIFGGLDRRIVVTGPPGTGKATILGRVADAALARGYSLDIFHCPMYPERIDHLRVRETGVGIVTSLWPHEFEPRKGDVVIDTGAFVDQAKTAQYADEIAGAEAAYRAAIDREIRHLVRAKTLHDELEGLYIPHMDFAAIERAREETLARILALIGPAAG